MKYHLYNNDAESFRGWIAPAEKLISRSLATTGPEPKYDSKLRALEVGDVVLMYQKIKGLVAVGTVLEKWDGKVHRDDWYCGTKKSPKTQYCFEVDWYLDFTENPIHFNLLKEAIGSLNGTIRRIDSKYWDNIENLIADRMDRNWLPKKKKKKPRRVKSETLRIVRDTALSRDVKRKYKFACQICNEYIELPDGNRYAEAHHVVPLGNPFEGDDTWDNVICVCPDHHVMLDKLVLPLNPKNLIFLKKHNIKPEFIDHHNRRYKVAKSKGSSKISSEGTT